jgi:hypothetical protein
MRIRWKRALPLAAAIVAVGCGGGESATAPVEDDGAWMDEAVVVVARDEGAAIETVTLTDRDSGARLAVEEPLTPGAVEIDDLEAIAAALVAGLSS